MVHWTGWLWLAGIITVQCVTADQPDVSIHICDIPLSLSDWSLCCVTHNIHSATVTFFHQSAQSSKVMDIAVVKHPCESMSVSSDYTVTCRSGVTGQRELVLKISNSTVIQNLGIWGCRYYGKSSTLNVRETQVLSENGGFVLANKSEDAKLNFEIPGYNTEDNVTIYSPQGETIGVITSGTIHIFHKIVKNLSFNMRHNVGIISLELQNVTLADNGTYVCEAQSSLYRYGLTLVVLEKLDKPEIISQNVKFDPISRKISSATLTCRAMRKSAAPYYYTPQIDVTWIYPQVDVTYNVMVNSSTLTITDVNCTTNRSQPIFCEARELSGPISDRIHFYPHSLCVSHTATMATPVVVQTVDKDDSDRPTLIALLVIGIVGLVVFAVMFCAGKKRVSKCCNFCCGKIAWCCGRTICRKCVSNVNNDFYSDYMDHPARDLGLPYIAGSQDRGGNWRDLLNVYSAGTVNNVPLPPPPTMRDVNNSTDENENEESTATGVIDAHDVSAVVGAEGVDRSVLIKEVESCLKELRKTLHQSQTQVQVIRENLTQNLFDIYTDPTIVDSYLYVKMVDEQGSDWGGVSRDCFTSFWNEVSGVFFRGNSVLVPYLPPHHLEEEYKFRILGRILAHSTAILGYIPVPLCKSVVMVTILDTTNIEESTLLEDFLLFLDREDGAIVRRALTNFQSLSEDDQDNLQDIFSRFDMGCLIQENTFRDQLLKMARNELCIKPRSLCELIREGIPQVHYERFWSQLTIDHLQILNDRLKPTADKIIACLRPDESEFNSRTEKVYRYFLDLIVDLPQEDLATLLQFITGQSCVPRSSITVNFSELTGVERRPIAHTCSFSIELPDSYESYEEFEREFKLFLKSDILKFDIQ